MNHSRTPWLLDKDGDVVGADCVVVVTAGTTSIEDAERIVACVNACKDISTEHLTQFPNWKLAVGNTARPGDVANLILKLGAYREALAQIAARDRAQEHEDNYMLACRVNAVIGIAQEALK